MKRVIGRLFGFSLIALLVIVVGIFLPTTPRASTNLLFKKLKTDSLLRYVKPPRIILVGGSNIALSINSQMLLDSLQLNPVNTSLSVLVGCAYMFDNTLKYVEKGDVVVSSLEYDHFYDRVAYGGHELVRIAFDVAPMELFGLRRQQLTQIITKLPYYGLTKFKPHEYFFEDDTLDVFTRDAFNKYGDNCKHWNLSEKKFLPHGPLPPKTDQFAFELLQEFKLAVEAKGAFVFLKFPAYQETSYKNRREGIGTIESEFKKGNYEVLGNPSRYIMPDSLMFDSPYHPTKAGVDLHTALLIEDLRVALKPKDLKTISSYKLR